MNDSMEYYVIPTPSLEPVVNRLKEHRIRSAYFVDEEDLARWPSLPEHRRFAAVYTLDVPLRRLGELFPKVLWLQTDRHPSRWQIDLCLDGVVTRLLFSDEHWRGYDESGNIAKLEPTTRPTDADLAAIERFFDVPRDAFAPVLRMGRLKAFARATGMPLYMPTNQRCMEWVLSQGYLDEKIVVPYDELD
ncbi:MAG: hypothetical protein IT372_03615 [Polyangiaceae bacterium]|nr:hypothetical protein [Polyangiaceae bacterium]